MAASILDTLTRSLGPSVLSKASATFGESDAAINKGFTAAIAAALAPMVARASDSHATRDVFEIVKGAPSQVTLLDEPDKLFSRALSEPDEVGPMAQLRSLLFGGKIHSITNAIANAAGIKPATATTLFSLAITTVVGYLSRLIRRENLDPASFGRRLAAERAPLTALLPARLSSLVSPGTAFVNDTARAGSRAVVAGRLTFDRAAFATAPARSSTGTWIAAALLGLLAVAASYALLGRSVPGLEGTPGAIGTAGYLSRSLPDRTSIRFPEASTEARLLAFIDANTPADRETWFEFDRITFDTDATTLRPQSQEQLSNIAAILKAFPTVNVKIGGYTDNTGDAGANLRLSQGRAEAVMAAIRNLGIAGHRLEAEGYGAQHPVADNNTAEGRSRNRRVAIRATAR
jgi:OOP family OmpA-OmpF porin